MNRLLRFQDQSSDITLPSRLNGHHAVRPQLNKE